jgi:oligoendopeptidase F
MNTATVPVEQTWNLADLYPDDDAFLTAKAALQETVEGLGRWQGQLTESAATLAEALEAITDAAKLFSRLRCYASLKSDGDTRIAKNQSMRQAVLLS